MGRTEADDAGSRGQARELFNFHKISLSQVQQEPLQRRTGARAQGDRNPVDHAAHGQGQARFTPQATRSGPDAVDPKAVPAEELDPLAPIVAPGPVDGDPNRTGRPPL